MNKKGFTLVELLAVIVILSIIAIITIPMIKGVIDKVKMKSLEDSVYGLKNAAELYYSSNEKVETTEFICNGSVCTSSSNKKISFKGKANGRVKLFSDGKISICIEDENYSSLLLAENKKPSTTLGTCDFTMEDYNVVELVSIERLREAENKLKILQINNEKLIKNLKDVNLITSTDSDIDLINSEVKTKYEEALDSASFDIYVDGKKYGTYPSGNYNVEITCDGAEGRWNNIYKTVMIGKVTKENLKCDVNFTTCTTTVCDTSDDAWVNWTGLLGYDYKQYKNFSDFLSKEMLINSCSDIDLFYDNTNGAYDYLSSQDSLIAEINQRVNFSKCSKDFAYKGSVEQYNVNADGIYKLEVYGAQGGGNAGGAGGFSSGYKELKKGAVLYVCVGGRGQSSWKNNTTALAQGGYNGGGSSGTNIDYVIRAAGGGATHIATKTGTLKELSYGNLSSIYIVAGGGGGSSSDASPGGAGGGTTGGNGLRGGQYIQGRGGTQTAAGGIDNANSFTYYGYNGGFGYGAGTVYANITIQGGGGGLYGGGAGNEEGNCGGGGSGYIGGVPAIPGTTYKPTTTAGANSGNGKAKITFIGIK